MAHADSSQGANPLYDVLSNERRRLAIKYLASLDDEAFPVRLCDLVDHVAETNRPDDAHPGRHRNRIYISLYQQHIPTLDRTDVIDYDSEMSTIEPGYRLEAVQFAIGTIESTTE